MDKTGKNRSQNRAKNQPALDARTLPLPDGRLRVDAAYDMAAEFVRHIDVLSHSLRQVGASYLDDVWGGHAGTYAMAFRSWRTFSELLSVNVRDVARRVHLPGDLPIRLTQHNCSGSWLEATSEVGVVFRNALYACKTHPLEPNLSEVARIANDERAESGETMDEAWNRVLVRETDRLWREKCLNTAVARFCLITKEWKSVDPDDRPGIARRLEFRSIDFKSLKIMLEREGIAALQLADSDEHKWVRSALIPDSMHGRVREAAREGRVRSIGAGRAVRYYLPDVCRLSNPVSELRTLAEVEAVLSGNLRKPESASASTRS